MNFPYYRIYNWCLIGQWIFLNTCTLIKQDFDARWQIGRFLRFLGWRWAGHRTYSSTEEMFCCPRRHCGHNLQPLLVSRGGQGHGMLKNHDLIGGGGGGGARDLWKKTFIWWNFSIWHGFWCYCRVRQFRWFIKGEHPELHSLKRAPLMTRYWKKPMSRLYSKSFWYKPISHSLLWIFFYSDQCYNLTTFINPSCLHQASLTESLSVAGWP